MFSKRYNLINNAGGWLVFVISLITYWLTLEPTASYWDCGEFIIQADKLEVGHPPGNPIFMLTARFFANFASSAETVSVMVNAMSGLLSALTILLLFWTITHLVRRLVVKDGQTKEISLRQYIAIMGSGLCGSLAYAWSDTFWFSAVEGEVYAFSSFCTALVFWLILKWENRADEPHSDRYLILIAYIIGVSVAVHLLNLLCIPAIVLVFAYRRFPDMNLKKSLLALVVSFVVIFLVLYGLVPGFIKVASEFELFFVNTLGMGFNSGVFIYAVLTLGVFAWCLYTLWQQKSFNRMFLSFVIAVAFSGMLCFGENGWLWILILAVFACALFYFFRKGFPVRAVSVIMWSIMVIFIGYSSYALILIRSSADTPMNQNSPDNVFDLASYLNREQYGERPLLYGETFNSGTRKRLLGYNEHDLGAYEGRQVIVSEPVYRPIINSGKTLYAKGVRGAEPVSSDGFLTEGDKARNASLAMRGKDYYVKKDRKAEPEMNPELNMFFPRLYSRLHKGAYSDWVTGLDDAATIAANSVEISAIDDETGDKVPELDTNGDYDVSPMGTIVFKPKHVFRPTYGQNMEFFFNYQLNHMYMRYFLWNFAGRQNDICNQYGEKDAGNWISGIPFIDNPRLGDQSKLPYELGEGNKGHNVYYMLPLILGIIGLLWQAFCGRRGIEQFWVIFFLFFMTGIAIVIYINQTPLQPRERDYSFAGSFYAFAIWIGMGVAGLWRVLLYFAGPKQKRPAGEEPVQIEAIVNEPESKARKSLYCAAVAALIGIAVPLQIVSQTWDDHDRSGRYAARDYAVNYLESLEPDAIVFCNGDNDTFPLWYAQEVEGVRPDVKIINLSYLNSDWYANQSRMPSYTAKPVKFTATPADYAYNKIDAVIVGDGDSALNLLDALKLVYKGYGLDKYGYPALPSGKVYIPVDKSAVLKRGLVRPEDADKIVDRIEVDLSSAQSVQSKGYVSLGEILMLDIIATNAANGWERPIYWASTVGDEYHVGLTPYMRSVGMTHQIVPTVQADKNPRTEKAYDVIMNKYRFGTSELAPGKKIPYFDETASRMLASVRGTMLMTAEELIDEGDNLKEKGNTSGAAREYRKALSILRLLEEKLPDSLRPYELQTGPAMAEMYCKLGERLADRKATERGLALMKTLLVRYAQYVEYEQSMRLSFGNTSLTYESRAVPYRYYNFVDIYRRYGGNMKELLSIPAIKRLNMDTLKKNWEDLQRSFSGEGESGDEVAQLSQMAYIVNTLAGMDAATYAQQGEESRLYDSIFYTAYEGVLDMGHTEAELKEDPNIGKVDFARSRRLSEELKRRRPDLFE